VGGELSSDQYFTTIAPSIAAEEIVGRLRHSVGELPFTWQPFIPLSPVILQRARYRELAVATARMLGLLVRTVHEIGPDSRCRARALGMDDRLDNLFVDQPTEDRLAPWMGRPDVIASRDGFKFIEFNVSAATGGSTHNHVLQHAWYAVYGCRSAVPPFRAPDPFVVRTRSFDRFCDQLGADRSIALIEETADLEPSHLLYDVQANYLTSCGYRVISGEPAALAAVAEQAPGSYALAMKQVVPQDLLDGGGTVSVLREACRIARIALSPQSSYQLSNKKVLGLLSAGADWMSARDRRFITEYLPWTRVIRVGKVEYNGRAADLERLLIGSQERFVVKGATGNSGRQTWIGCQLNTQDWQATVEAAFASGNCIAQEYVEGVPLRVPLWDVTAGQACERAVTGVLSPFIIDGANSGCHLRYALHERNEVVGIRRRDVQFNTVLAL
jgi:hypothetical protein